ncbi:MAG: alkaline phosphatase family protein [Acidobacteriia bacterium]|nr:alkaline phosphatase family protein [Terriglobia bacterium]
MLGRPLSKERSAEIHNLILGRERSRWWQRVQGLIFLLSVVWALLHPHTDGAFQHLAYVGPGAGFVFVGSFLSILFGFLAAIFSFLIWPFRMAWRFVTRSHSLRKAHVRKIIFLGMDGLDPKLAEKFMEEGKMPNFSRLRAEGSYRRLRTTFPALSPVAWSTFATGVNPAKHNMFDFLNRNLVSYLPELASSKVYPPKRFWKIGRYRIPLSRPLIEMRRKSQPFWKILGEHFIPSTIIRVPLTFPPEKFNGRLLSAMCTPDLLGSQGTFAFFTTRAGEAQYESGIRTLLRKAGADLHGELQGPPNHLVEGGASMRISFRLTGRDSQKATLEIDGARYVLRVGEYTDWISLKFRASLGVSVRGICRFLLTETQPEVSLYVTPINIDPEQPALPISHPSLYSIYLAKLLGPYGTLGLAEDTWALNEQVIDDDAFLKQAYDLYAERESMFFSALERLDWGVLACVFDTSDRVQHMFYRFLESEGARADGKYARVIEDLYCRMDQLLGKTLAFVDDQTALFVLSDHGFGSFRRGVNLNTWLHQNGYLAIKEGVAPSAIGLQDIDWSRTRAYAFGLAGMYFNLKGRESQGIVSPGREADELKREISGRLSGLLDPDKGQIAINQVLGSGDVYRGPYLESAPDLLVGYNNGYRISWAATLGRTTPTVFEDNEKAWAGDHCIDPRLVPGVLFSNRTVAADDPGLEDLAPTSLTLFGVTPPKYMEGRPIFPLAADQAPA